MTLTPLAPVTPRLLPGCGADALLEAARTSLLEAAERLASILREQPTSATPVPASAWTIRDVAAHIAGWAPAYAATAAGQASPLRSLDRDYIAAHNARLLTAVPATDPAELAELVLGGARGVVAATAAPGKARVPFHAGTTQDLAGLAGFALGEMLLHGYDLASAVGSPWTILPADVALVLRAYGPLVAGVVDTEATWRMSVTYEVDLGHAGRFGSAFVGGAFGTVDPDVVRADCRIEACPRAFLLVMTGRLNVWTAITLGLWRGAGPRPGLAPRYPRLFRCV